MIKFDFTEINSITQNKPTCIESWDPMVSPTRRELLAFHATKSASRGLMKSARS